MKHLCCALVAGLAAVAAAQPAANHNQSKNPKPAVDYLALRERYFPFHLGNVRSYAYHGHRTIAWQMTRLHLHAVGIPCASGAMGMRPFPVWRARRIFAREASFTIAGGDH